jgi:hypothetical protein
VGRARNEKPPSRSKDNPRGTTDQTGSVGAPARTSRIDNNNVGNEESWDGSGTHIRHTSVEGACHNVGRGYLDKEKHTSQEASG